MYNAPQQNYAPQGYGVPMLNYAGFGVRAVALIIDGIVLGVISGILSGILGTSGSLASIILDIAYYAVCFSQFGGVSLGQKVMGLRTVKEDGSPITMGGFLLYRILGYLLNSFIFFIGFIWAAFSPKKQTWGQLVGKMVTIRA